MKLEGDKFRQLDHSYDEVLRRMLDEGDHDAVLRTVRTALASVPDERIPIRCPVDGGEYGELVRSVDWAATSFGSVETWSAELRTTVNNVINSSVPKVLMWGADHTMLYNEAYAEMAGANHPYALGRTVLEIWPEIWDFMESTLIAGLSGQVQRHADLPMVVRRYGEDENVVLDLYFTPIYLLDGSVAGVMGILIENTKRVAMELALARSEAELRIITDAMPVLIAYVDRGHVYRFVNSAFTTWFARKADAVIGRHVREITGEEQYRANLPLYERVLAGETVVMDRQIPHSDGSLRASEVQYIPRVEANGSIDGFHVLVFDVQDRVHRAEALEREVQQRIRAENELRVLNETLEARVAEEIAVRRQAEAALAQAQKIETMGQLTGGVAHDFNNLLQVVSGNIQMLTEDVGDSERGQRRIAHAMAGVARGAKLAAQLLAFGRRQVLEPKIVDVSRIVRDMDDILRRAVGEGVELETASIPDLWNTFIDVAQIENAILNLVINARDAMEGQGTLTIELTNATLAPDHVHANDNVNRKEYVQVAVSDTGSGMPPGIVEKVFEPFFSTKAEGKGSGLGLSMVHGFVNQSGGHVRIETAVGEGTTIRLYLPRREGPAEIPPTPAPIVLIGGDETILVVEDDEDVRATVADMLTGLGYAVIEAPDATVALRIIEEGATIDLLFTDVLMPGHVRSPDLPRLARPYLPELAVLFTSGYTDRAFVDGGNLAEGVELISKPYSREALSTRIRAVLAKHRLSRRRQSARDTVVHFPVPGA